jgi:hypothetical protein
MGYFRTALKAGKVVEICTASTLTYILAGILSRKHSVPRWSFWQITVAADLVPALPSTSKFGLRRRETRMVAKIKNCRSSSTCLKELA